MEKNIGAMTLTHLWLASNLAAAALAASSIAGDVTFESLNEAFDQPVWVDENLWDDSDEDLAKRLGWPQESRTSFDSSYRQYPGKGATALGTRPFSVVLYGTEGLASQISMVFANKGDVEQLAEIDSSMSETQVDRELSRVARDFKKIIADDEKVIADRLTALLGEPVADRFGQGRTTTERVQRWDWNGHTILLAAPRAEYVAVRVIPVSVADGEATERVSRSELKDKLGQRVERRENGDVILKDMPMVDQGPKGYCSPATWERVMRYVGIPADMYILAMAGSTSVGGGTSSSNMMYGVSDVIRRNGRRIVTDGGRITTRSVARSIDQGLPMIWQMMVVDEVNESVTSRSLQRLSVTDWAAYQELLKPWRSAARRIRKNEGGAHICMIIGYNDETKEIAISDSWGPEFSERWITEEEANMISNGQVFLVSW
jgi:hypothetical protein